MKAAPSINRLVFIFGMPLVLLTSLFFLIRNSDFQSIPYWNLAVSIDLLLTIPIFCFLSMRRTKTPKTTVLPVMLLGFLMGSFLLSGEDLVYLTYFEHWILPILELSILAWVTIKVLKVFKVHKGAERMDDDFFGVLTKICSKSFPKGISALLASEIAVFYYGFLFRKNREFTPNEFTYHKNSGSLSLMGAIVLVVGVETVVLHLLLSKWNETFAWILTALSIYTMIQLFGFLKSILDRPHKLEGEKLYLRYGIMNETIIERKEVQSVELSSKDISTGEDFQRLSFLGSLEDHNIIIRLKHEKSLVGLYGTKKKYKTLLLFVDDKVEFKNRLEVHGS